MGNISISDAVLPYLLVKPPKGRRGWYTNDGDDEQAQPESSKRKGGKRKGKGKRKAGDDLDDRFATKARTLGGDRVREAITVRPITNRAAPPVGVGMYTEGSRLAGRLEPPQLVTYLKATVEGSEDLFEGRNPEGDGAWTLCRMRC